MHVNVHDHVCVCTCTKKIICMYAYFFEKIYTPWRGGGYTSRTSILGEPEIAATILLWGPLEKKFWDAPIGNRGRGIRIRCPNFPGANGSGEIK